MKSLSATILLTFALLTGCGNESSVNTNGNPVNTYNKILTAESDGKKFEVWSGSGSNLIYGYNNIGIKVYQDGVEKTDGYVKYKPTMFHGVGGPSHSVPVKEKFFYDNSERMFKGYAVFIMYDETAFWTGDYNFNDEIFVDSSVFQITLNRSSQILVWDNVNTERTYIVTLVSPLSPQVGLNEINLMLHETVDLQSYKELDSAEMFIKPWMQSMGHGSTNNVNPSFHNGGAYKGTVNFNMGGEWYVYDSIVYRGTTLTRTPSPKFNFEIN